ncbi:MAG: hypothetical protein WC795_00395 [Candidatus Paceibacterota bacterium]|jgi:hypothetical protein
MKTRGFIHNIILIIFGIILSILAVGLVLLSFLPTAPIASIKGDLINTYLQSGGFYILKFIWDLAPFWVPPLLIIAAWRLWKYYINYAFLTKMNWVLLEVRIPKDVHKSPLAMEVVLTNAFYQAGGTGTWYAKHWEGKLRNWFSLEMVSIEGKIFFFIRTPVQFKNIIEAQIYSQYPKAEINEVDDYTNLVPLHANTDAWELTGTEFVLSKEDPYPIKTYIDYGLDKASGLLEAEQQIDPISSTMELLGSIGKDEQIWIQIIIRATTERFHKPGTWFGKQDWKKEGEALIKKLKDELKPKPKDKDDKPAPQMATKGEQEKINAVERSIDKFGFDCGIRTLYVAKKDAFKGMNLVALLGAFRQYNSANLNGFKPANVTSFDYPWQDFSGRRIQALKREIFDAYRARSYFYMPHSSSFVAGKSITRKQFVLNTEELATIFHFPGRVSETPSFKRIESKKAEPPVNLPM